MTQKREELASDLRSRLGKAELRREAIILSIVETDRPEAPGQDPALFERLSLEVDTLQSEIDHCAHELRLRRWADGRMNAAHLVPAPTARAVGRPGWVARLALWCCLGDASQRSHA